MVSPHAWRDFFKSLVWQEIEEELLGELAALREDLETVRGEAVIEKQMELKKVKSMLEWYSIQKDESEVEEREDENGNG